MIVLEKILHKGGSYIALRFEYNLEIKTKLKTLPGIKYSRTHRCWYIPNSWVVFEAFRKLGIEYEKKETNAKTTGTRLSPEKSENSCIAVLAANQSGPVKAGGKPGTDINPLKRGLKKIVWQGGFFFICIDYVKPEVSFLKGLYGAYWNKKYKNWVCRGNRQNLYKLQNRYAYWPERTYHELMKLCLKYRSRSRVIIQAMAGDPKHLEINIRYADKAVELVKKIPERRWDANSKRWIIPREEQSVIRFSDECKNLGYEVQSRVSWALTEPLSHSRDGSRKLKSVMKNIPSKHLETIKNYAEILLRENYSYNTMKQYVPTFLRFLTHEGGVEKVCKYGIAEMNNYINSIAVKKVSYQEINRHISAIKFYYEKMCGWSQIRLDQVERPRRSQKLPNVMSMGEIKRLYSQLKNPKHLALLYLAYGCGLRPGELVVLRLRDLKLDRGQLYVRSGKGNKDRVVPIPEVVYPVLNDYIEYERPDNWLFPGQNRAKPYSKSSVRAIFKRACKGAGIIGGYKLYDLRHSYATHLLESGTQQRLIQKLLGHKSSKTTEIYTHVSRTSLEKVVSPLDTMMQKKKCFPEEK